MLKEEEAMMKLPEVNISFADLYMALAAPVRTKLLLTGIELKVFNLLSEPTSAGTVAQATSAHPGNTRLFLDGLAATALVQKKNNLYQNTPVTQAFLVEGSPTYLGQFLTFVNRWFAPALEDLPRLVREGPTPRPEAGEEPEEIWTQYAASGADYQRAGMAQQAVEIVSRLPEFPAFRKMLDLGGGPGLIGVAIVAAHPNMKGIIFDLPAMVKVTETFIKEYKMEDRIDVLDGDYNHDSIGGGYDLVWASASLNFGKDNMDSLMKKIYDALNPGGVFISCQDGLTHERTKPAIHVLSMMSTALMGQDMYFNQGFIADTMLRVGFKCVRSRTLDMPVGPMDLDIARK